MSDKVLAYATLALYGISGVVLIATGVALVKGCNGAEAMTTNDLKAARERWMRKPYGAYEHERRRNDSDALADAYVALFDETPITQEWLEANGFRDALLGWMRSARPMLHAETNLPIGELLGSEDEWYTQFTAKLKTLGELRLLLLAMGVGE